LDKNLKIIEALLFASPDPINQMIINKIFPKKPPDLKKAIFSLNTIYKNESHSFEIISIAGGFQLVSLEEFEYYIRLMLSNSDKITLSSAAMDTLSIIAYKQPINRYEIEAIRGVDSSGVIKTLLNKKLVAIKGRDSGPGRPLLYHTSKAFLEHFGLNHLSDLPKLKEISEILESDTTLGQQIEAFNDISKNEKDSNNK
tara:strand:+ start:380 stop:976 length:597 start_codon:yes stop_codon:yes gene_type:complete